MLPLKMQHTRTWCCVAMFDLSIKCLCQIPVFLHLKKMVKFHCNSMLNLEITRVRHFIRPPRKQNILPQIPQIKQGCSSWTYRVYSAMNMLTYEIPKWLFHLITLSTYLLISSSTKVTVSSYNIINISINFQ